MAEAAWLAAAVPRGGGDRGGNTRRSGRSADAATFRVRPLVLGGCCCAHVGAIRGLAARAGRLAVVWFDAHGDLNTPE